MIPGLTHRRPFRDFPQQAVLALANSSEEDDSRIYETYAGRLRPDARRRRPSSTAWPRRSASTAAG